MILKEIASNKIEALRYLERYVNNVKVGHHTKWSDSSPAYSPHEGLDNFNVETYVVSEDQCRVFLAKPDEEIKRFLFNDTVKFMAHPELSNDSEFRERVGLNQLKKSDIKINVTPTSSTRTLLTKDYQPVFFIKTDFERRHFGDIRSLKLSAVRHSINICNEFYRIVEDEKFDVFLFSFLPESIGIVIGEEEDEKNSGMIIREIYPTPRTQENRIIIPYFSLYAEDVLNDDHLPLLIQLISANVAHDQSLDYFVNVIIGMIQKVWITFLTKYGILLECHGQNTLIEMDTSFKPQRIVVRDFQGIYFDEVFRKRNQLGIPEHCKIVGRPTGLSRRKHISHIYDNFMGELLFKRMTNTFVKHFTDYSFEEVAALIKNQFNALYSDVSAILPKKAYRFDKSYDQENKSVFSTKRLSNPNPLFR